MRSGFYRIINGYGRFVNADSKRKSMKALKSMRK